MFQNQKTYDVHNNAHVRGTLLLVALLLALPLVLVLAYFTLAEQVFRLLGISRTGAVLLLVGSLLGSMINIPLRRTRLVLDPAIGVASLPSWVRWMRQFVYYYPPAVVEQVLAVNVGGCLIPLVFSAYLFTRPAIGWMATIGATALVACVTKLLARVKPGVGVTLPALIPPLVAALAARGLVLLLGMPAASAVPAAYIAGTLGTLIGVDLLNLHAISRGVLAGLDHTGRVAEEWPPLAFPEVAPPKHHRYIASIGGAGVFDGIFLASIIAPLLASW